VYPAEVERIFARAHAEWGEVVCALLAADALDESEATSASSDA
jgi:hypothetical protein